MGLQEHKFYFISKDAFLSLHGPLQRHQAARSAGLLTEKVIRLKDVIDGNLRADHAAISHRWLADFHPDPEGKKLQRLQALLRKDKRLASIQWIWLDFIDVHIF